MTEQRWQLPLTWRWVRMGEISTIVGGGTPPTNEEANFNPDGIPWITPADLTGYTDTYISRGRRGLTERGFELSSARLVPKGTVLYSSRAPIGYCVIAANLLTTSQGFKSFILEDEISPEYTRYYLLASVEYAESVASGTTFKELSSSKASQLLYPLPPVLEQRRIAAKIESLLLRTKWIKSQLASISRLAEKYKELILEAAYTGNLSTVSNEAPKQIVELREVATDFSYGSSAKSQPSGKVPVLRMGNIQDGRLSWDQLVYTSDDNEIGKYGLKAGDVLFNRTNSPELVGKTAVYNGEREAIYAGYLIRVRCSDQLNPDYLSYCLNSPSGKAYCQRVKNDGISQSNINAQKLAAFRFPLPSMEKQVEIVRLVKLAFQRVQRLREEVENVKKLVERLNQSILTKAFCGALVAQNSSEESINLLLERIINARKNAVKPAKRRKAQIEPIMKKQLVDVLSETNDWMDAQEAFRLCGIHPDAPTEEIEPLYEELRGLDISGQLLVLTIRDADGRKLYDRIKLNKQDYAS